MNIYKCLGFPDFHCEYWIVFCKPRLTCNYAHNQAIKCKNYSRHHEMHVFSLPATLWCKDLIFTCTPFALSQQITPNIEPCLHCQNGCKGLECTQWIGISSSFWFWMSVKARKESIFVAWAENRKQLVMTKAFLLFNHNTWKYSILISYGNRPIHVLAKLKN